MENKKGSGIFLGVVSVATLIVAIIGATFAFFSASITGSNNVNLTAYEFNASLSVSPIYPTAATKLVPLAPEGAVIGGTPTNATNLLYAMNEAETRCVDSNGYQVCAVYQAVFTNNGSTAVTLSGTLTTLANNPGSLEGATGFTNLKFSELSGTHTENNLATTGDLYEVPTAPNGTVNIGTITVDPEQSVTKYFVVYLNEAQEANNPEMGSTYEGQLVYTSTAGGQQLTGTFNLGAAEDNGEEGTE